MAVVKSIYAMTDEEVDWAIGDAEAGPAGGRWQPRVMRGGRSGG
jgi:hypothetical protein